MSDYLVPIMTGRQLSNDEGRPKIPLVYPGRYWVEPPDLLQGSWRLPLRHQALQETRAQQGRSNDRNSIRPLPISHRGPVNHCQALSQSEMDRCGAIRPSWRSYAGANTFAKVLTQHAPETNKINSSISAVCMCCESYPLCMTTGYHIRNTCL